MSRNRRQFLSLLGLSLASAVAGCGGGSSSPTPTPTPTPTPLSEIVPQNLNRSTELLPAGGSRDGVRTEIHDYIQRLSLSPAEKSTLLSFAQNVQRTLTENSSRDQAVGAAQTLFTAVSAFANANADAGYFLRRVFAYTVNTPTRAEAYLLFERNLGGAVLRPNFAVSRRQTTRSVDVCTGAGYVFAFVNGIQTVAVDAFLSLNALNQMFGSSFNDEGITYEQYYNPTESLIRDLLESARQKFAELGISDNLEYVWALIFRDYGFADIVASVVEWFSPTVGSGLQALRQQINRLIQAAVSALPNPEPVTGAIAGALTVNTTERRKVLLFAHSQGNFFANAAYDRVAPGLTANAIGVVHVATPTSSVRGSYFTSTNDVVMGSIPTALPGNVTIPFTLADPLGHNLVEIYLNPSRSGTPARIRDAVQTTMASLVSQAQGGTAGFFTVTLTWDGPGDVDLHVVEPSGTHVYYASRRGGNGYLDVDNTSANGPEHYFANCDSDILSPGLYQIGINNYARATGRTATLSLATQDRIYDPIRLSVGEERGSGGNGSPIQVFDVQVTVDSNGQYTARMVSGRAASAAMRAVRVPNDAKR